MSAGSLFVCSLVSRGKTTILGALLNGSFEVINWRVAAISETANDSNVQRARVDPVALHDVTLTKIPVDDPVRLGGVAPATIEFAGMSVSVDNYAP